MKLLKIFKESLLEAKKKKPSEGLSKKEKSEVVKKAKAGKDIGKKGKGFEKIAAKAGGGEKGKKIAAAAMWKNIKRKGAMNESEYLDEIGPNDWAYKQIDGVYKKNDDRVNNEIKKSLMLNKSADYEKFKNALSVAGKEDVSELIEKLKKLLPNEKLGLEENKDHEVDEEGGMAKSQLKAIAAYANAISDMLEDDTQLDAWVQGHISKAEQLMDQVGHFMEGEEEGEEDDDDDEKEQAATIYTV